MCLKHWLVVLLLCAPRVCVAGDSIVPTTTLAAQIGNNTSAANNFSTQTNGNAGATNVSKVNVHSLLYKGATTKVYAHLLLWFGGSNHMNVGYSSTDPQQVHRQIDDMISRGIDGVIIDWYGPNNSIDDATKLVMAEAEAHPGFTFAIMVDQGAIKWNSCSGCSPQEALITQLQYVEQTYFPSKAYMTLLGKPVVTNFNIDLAYAIDWNAVNTSLSTQPAFLFQNNDGFSHVLSQGSYSWVMPTTSDYGVGYLSSFYDVGMASTGEETVGALYKGFNDTLASWGSNRIMQQECGQTWLKTFSEINGLYSSGNQLGALQLVTWNDYEEGTEIESGINNCLSISASAAGNSLQWTVHGDESTSDHYSIFISADGTNLMPLAQISPGNQSMNLCGYSIPDGSYTAYIQAVGKPSITNQMSSAVEVNLQCGEVGSNAGWTIAASPPALSIPTQGSGHLTVIVAPQSGAFNGSVTLSCSDLRSNLKCAFAPPSVIPGAASIDSVLTITDTSMSSGNNERHCFFLANLLLGLGACGIFLTGRIPRRSAFSAVGTGLALMFVAGVISCGGQSPSSVGAQNSYVVTVNGSSGSTQVSTTVTVTVN